MYLNIDVLENFANFIVISIYNFANICVGVLFLIKMLAFNFITRHTNTGVFLCEVFKSTFFFTEYLWWLLLENLFRSSKIRSLHITGEIYAVIWQRLLLLLLENVSSCIRRTLMFGCLSYMPLYKGDQTETGYITKSTSLHYLAIISY